MSETQLPEVFCHVCMRKVRVAKGLVSYFCPACGQQFTQSAIDDARGTPRPEQPAKSDSAAA